MNKEFHISVSAACQRKIEDAAKRLMRDGSFDPALLEGVPIKRRNGKKYIPQSAIVELACRDILEGK